MTTGYYLLNPRYQDTGANRITFEFDTAAGQIRVNNDNWRETTLEGLTSLITQVGKTGRLIKFDYDDLIYITSDPTLPAPCIQFRQGNFGEGYNTYAQFNILWYSVNGTQNHITEIHWTVCRPTVLQNLNTFHPPIPPVTHCNVNPLAFTVPVRPGIVSNKQSNAIRRLTVKQTTK